MRPVPPDALLLGYVVLVSAVITLAPFRFAWPEAVRLSWLLKPDDLVANVLLFAPFGFLLEPLVRRHGPATRRGAGADVRVLGAAMLLSAGLEAAQCLLPGRYPSPVDVVTNGVGAWLGGGLRQRLERRLDARLVRRLALQLPLMNLVYLLVPLLWLDGLAAGHEAARLWMLPLLGWLGGRVLVAVWRHRLRPAGAVAAPTLALAAGTWFVAGAAPGLAGRPGLLLAVTLGLVGLVGLEAARGWDPGAAAERRFELATLRGVSPLYALYLVATALWPWPWAPGAWRGSAGLADVADQPGLVPMLRLVEYLAAFTLGGYMVAEARGRREEPLPRLAGWVAAACLAAAAALEVARGFHPAHVASLARLGLATAAALYGGVLYRVQLRLVRELRGSASRPPGTRATEPPRGR